MNRLSRAIVYLAVVLVVGLTVRQTAHAQNVTTGALSGRVVDEQGGVLPGADVTAVHEPTGTTYTVVTRGDGRFAFVNVRVGGPYSITVRLPGFKEQRLDGITVMLGEDTNAGEVKLPLETVTETVTVVGESSALFTGAKAGTSSTVIGQTIENLPTVARNLNDFARLSPYVSTNAGRGGLVIAGRSSRYNNIQIDGSVNNDVFGLPDSGTPGGQSETQPISLDAIQELQLAIAPYDVRQSGFSGGGVNAITKSGSNDFHGTAYYFFRDEDMTGKSPDGRKVGTFSDKQFGGSFGGRIVKNKAFFFGNVDFGRKDQPSGWSINGTGTQFGNTASAEGFRQILTSRYGYDPGGLDEVTRRTDNDKVFVRGDFNIGTRHQLTVRHNYVNAFNDRGFPDQRTYWYPNNFYQFKNDTNSTVGQLNSTFSSMFNEFRIAFQTIRDERGGIGDRFPQVQAGLPDGTTLQAGTEAFSTANSLDQNVLELNNDLTMVRGRHQLTFGTHNEFFGFDNLFIQNNFGSYYFSSLDNLGLGLAQGYNYSFSATSDPKQSAKFDVYQLGFYASDQWRATSKLTLTLGLRFDKVVFPDEPGFNEFILTGFGIDNSDMPSPALWSPRAGFNYELGGERRQQLRGGIGIFSGRTPYVWISNNYVNNGLLLRNLSVSRNNANQIPFSPDPDNQPTQIGTISGAASTEFNVIDPDFVFPRVLRTNVAYDRELGFWNLIASAELLYSKTLKDIVYQNLNVVPTGGQAFDGRPTFQRKIATVDGAYYLTNTDEGDQWNLALRLDRPFSNNFYASGSYFYGRAQSVNDGTSSRAVSNWGNNPVQGDPNDPALAYSNFDVRHRVNTAFSYTARLFAATDWTFSIFYNGQSGRPYSVIFNSGSGAVDVNGDRRFDNDLFYVPRSADEIVITSGGTWEQLDAYIEGDPGLRDARGQVVERNASRLDWMNTFDFRIAVGVPFGKYKGEITFDLLNLANLIDQEKGQFYDPAFPGLGPVQYQGIDPATGKPLYRLIFTQSTFREADRNDLASRWQGQLGFRFRF